MDGEEGKIWNEKKDSPTIKNKIIFSRIHIAERYYKVSPGKNLLLGEFFSHTFLHPRSPSCYTHVCSPFLFLLFLFLFLPLLFVLPFLLLVCPKVRTAMKERKGGRRDRPRRGKRVWDRMQKCRQQKRIETEKQYCIKIDTFCCLSLFSFAYMYNLQKTGNEHRSNFSKTVLNKDRKGNFMNSCHTWESEGDIFYHIR